MSTGVTKEKRVEVRRLHLNDSRHLSELNISEAVRVESGQRLAEALRKFKNRGDTASMFAMLEDGGLVGVLFAQESYGKEEILIEFYFEQTVSQKSQRFYLNYLYENFAQRYFILLANFPLQPLEKMLTFPVQRKEESLREKHLYFVERTELSKNKTRVFLYDNRYYFLFKFSEDRTSLKSLLICPVGLTVVEGYFREQFLSLNLLSPYNEVLLGENFVDPRPKLEPLQTKLEKELVLYLEGKLQTFDWPIEYPDEASEFQRKVWDAIQDIPYAGVLSYEDLAAKVVGRELAKDYARAVGSACSTNPLMLVVPCHRVIGQGGELKGFRSGVQTKAWLLDRELLQYRH